ncbi:unnamed protein product [Somion occarium]|uniref:GmrSD restriction endonucleases N-terminal domain-containing protein n=1 Tax=Somion occarium TaxID=3059160 RepID=A0ABP1D4H0_9APHY
MSDDYSDLTDIDDEPDVPLSQVSPKQKGKKTTDRVDATLITGALHMPRSANYSTESLYSQMVSDDINLDADYQRDVVWPDAKQIDSLFRNYYIPPIIFALKQETDGSQKRVCIDGKQRLTSIWRFMEGHIPYKNPATGEKFYFRDTAAKKVGRVLPEKYKNIFRMKTLVCIEYDRLSGDDEREIFQRVQLGMALTPAEKMQAINTKRATFIRELSAKFVQNGLGTYLDWDTSRAADFRGVASAVYCIDNWPTTNPPSLVILTKWLSQPIDFDTDFKEDVSQTFSIFLELAKTSKLNSVFKLKGVKKVAPVEFMFITGLISRFKGKMTLAQLSEAIGKMRQHIREVETDIRTNGRVMKHLNSFIDKLQISQLTSDRGSLVAAKRIPAPSLKRKRANSESLSSDKGGTSEEDAIQNKPPKKTTKPRPPAKPSPTPPLSTSQPPPAPQTVQPSSHNVPAASSQFSQPSSSTPQPQPFTTPHPLPSRPPTRPPSPPQRPMSSAPPPQVQRLQSYHTSYRQYPNEPLPNPFPNDASEPRHMPHMTQPPLVLSASSMRPPSASGSRSRPPTPNQSNSPKMWNAPSTSSTSADRLAAIRLAKEAGPRSVLPHQQSSQLLPSGPRDLRMSQYHSPPDSHNEAVVNSLLARVGGVAQEAPHPRFATGPNGYGRSLPPHYAYQPSAGYGPNSSGGQPPGYNPSQPFLDNGWQSRNDRRGSYSSGR